jgi:predicted RNase H-like nuclease (RuvC/YqgF family)
MDNRECIGFSTADNMIKQLHLENNQLREHISEWKKAWEKSDKLVKELRKEIEMLSEQGINKEIVKLKEKIIRIERKIWG